MMADSPIDKKIDDGGPFNPYCPYGREITYTFGQDTGISVRMWLAGMNHAAMLGNSDFNLDPQEMSELALRHAEALIRES